MAANTAWFVPPSRAWTLTDQVFKIVSGSVVWGDLDPNGEFIPELSDMAETLLVPSDASSDPIESE